MDCENPAIIKRNIRLLDHPEGLTGPYVVEEIYRQTEGRCNYCHRGWTEPDVGSAVL